MQVRTHCSTASSYQGLSYVVTCYVSYVYVGLTAQTYPPEGSPATIVALWDHQERLDNQCFALVVSQQRTVDLATFNKAMYGVPYSTSTTSPWDLWTLLDLLSLASSGQDPDWYDVRILAYDEAYNHAYEAEGMIQEARALWMANLSE